MADERRPIFDVPLFGQGNLLESLSREFRGENSGASSGDYVLWTFAALAVAVGAKWMAAMAPVSLRFISSGKGE